MPVAALMVAIISIQYGSTFAKSLFPAVGAEGTTALRLVFGGLILAIFMRPWRARPSRKVLPALIGYGIILAIMNLLFYSSLKTIPLGVAVALEFCGPLLVAVLSSRRWVHFVWIGLAAAGILLLSPLVPADRPLDHRGVLFALGAGACWALYIVFGQRAGRELGSQTSSIGTLLAAVLVLPVGLAHAGSALFAPPILLSAAIVGLLCSAVPFYFEMIALMKMPARIYGTLTSLEPALGAVMGFVFLHEALTPMQLAGIAAVVTAALGATLAYKTPVPLVD